MKITLSKTGKIAFEVATESGHRLSTDGSPDNGGNNAGARPMELLLAALGSCSGIDVALILEKSRQTVTDCRITVEGQRADAVPAVFTEIHVHYTVAGPDLDPRKVGRAVALSMEKYCSVTRMLQASVNVTHSFDIEAA